MLLPTMPSDDNADPRGRNKRAAARLKELLERAERGSKAALGRKLQSEEGYASGEQILRKYMNGTIAFTRRPQRIVARLIRELGIADIPDDHFDRDGDGEPVIDQATRHASLTNVLARRAYREQTVGHLLTYDRDLATDDPGERYWEDLAGFIEGAYAADEARRGPTKPRGAGPARRR